jgi:hypothetical protein
VFLVQDKADDIIASFVWMIAAVEEAFDEIKDPTFMLQTMYK